MLILTRKAGESFELSNQIGNARDEIKEEINNIRK